MLNTRALTELEADFCPDTIAERSGDEHAECLCGSSPLAEGSSPRTDVQHNSIQTIN